jgi:hypothetical protein
MERNENLSEKDTSKIAYLTVFSIPHSTLQLHLSRRDGVCVRQPSNEGVLHGLFRPCSTRVSSLSDSAVQRRSEKSKKEHRISIEPMKRETTRDSPQTEPV